MEGNSYISRKNLIPRLAHLSYIIGADGQAAVIDPRRDIEVYEEVAAANNVRISCIFETHRNEDLLSGAGLLIEAAIDTALVEQLEGITHKLEGLAHELRNNAEFFDWKLVLKYAK